MPQLPRVGDLLGRYRIDDQIGFGGMGVVYGATDLDLGRRVAIKVVSGSLGDSDEFVRRFEREAALLARLASPHVIGVYDYGEHEGNPFIVTQYVGGGDLGQLLRSRGPMPPNLATRLCAQVAEALADTHRLGVIHRDVKPSNVLLRDPDEPRLQAFLCDFGIARTESDGITVAGGIAGTWRYLAPEVGLGQPASPRSDIYALGCVLWATLTGQAPYAGSDLEVAVAHQQAPVPQLAGTDPFSQHANLILRRCLAKTPSERYADADSLRSDLMAASRLPAGPVVPLEHHLPRALSGGGSSGAGRTPTPFTVPGTSRRRRTALVAATAAGVLVVGGGAALAVTRPWHGSPDPVAHGSGGPTSSPTSSSTATGAHVGPVHGDLDGDGFGDVMISRTNADYKDDALDTFKSTGTRLVAQPVQRVPEKGPYDWFAADLDGDGHQEVASITSHKVSKDTYDEVVTAELSGGGRYRAAARVPGSGVSSVAGATDVDGDGKADLIGVSYGFDKAHDYNVVGPLTVYAATTSGTGAGSLHKLVSVPLKGGKWSMNYVVSDLTGDGKADLAVYQTLPYFDSPDKRMHAQLAVYSSAGPGLGAPPLTRTFDGARDQYTAGTLAGDVDGDGQQELVLLNYIEGGTGVYAVKVGSTIGRARLWGTGQYSGTTTLSDVNGDGNDDVVTLTSSKNRKTLWVKVATSAHGQFGSATTWCRTQGLIARGYQYFVDTEPRG